MELMDGFRVAVETTSSRDLLLLLLLLLLFTEKEVRGLLSTGSLFRWLQWQGLDLDEARRFLHISHVGSGAQTFRPLSAAIPRLLSRN